MLSKLKVGLQKFTCVLHQNVLQTSRRYCVDSTHAPGMVRVPSVKTLKDDELEQLRSIKRYEKDVEGQKISYEKTGLGRNVVLLLPGAIGSSQTDFLLQMENLNKDLFTLIAWDPPGYGYSRPPERTWPSNFFERDADFAAKLMQNLDCKKFSVLGWSDGGITGLILAAKYPDLMKKLIVFGANSYVTEEETKDYEKIRDISAWSPRMKQPFIDLYGKELFQKLWGEWVTAISQYYYENNGNICNHLLEDIKCPTLIVHGQKDALVPQFHPDHLHKTIQNSRLVNYPDGKHNLHMKYFKEFNSLVEEFFLEPSDK